MSELRGILFDKDGTLLDYHATWMPANFAVATNLSGGDAAKAEMLLMLGGWDKSTGRVRSGSPMAAGDLTEITQLWAPYIDPVAAADLKALERRIDRIFIDAAQPTPVCDLAALADRLSAAGYILGVATSDSEEGARRSLEGTGVLEAAGFVAGYDSGHGRKPGPGMALAFCATTGLNPDEIVVVGDNAHDIELGHSAGARASIGVLTGTSTREELLELTDHVLDSIGELEAYLETW